MKFNANQFEELNTHLTAFSKLCNVAVPVNGWIKSIRTALGMSLQQLGRKLGVTKQAVQDMEKREVNGSITLQALKEIAKVFDMELIYGFRPKEGTLDTYIERKATALAQQLINGQAGDADEAHMAIASKAAQLKASMSKMLWD